VPCAHPFTDPGQIWQETRGIRLHVKFHLNPRTKTVIFGTFWHFLGFLYQPLLPIRANQIWCARVDPWSMFVPNFVSIGLFCRPIAEKTPNFAVLWTSEFCGLANWRQSEIVKCGCTNTNIPYPTVSKNHFCIPTSSWQNRAHSLCHSKVWQTHKHTNKQVLPK